MMEQSRFSWFDSADQSWHATRLTGFPWSAHWPAFHDGFSLLAKNRCGINFIWEILINYLRRAERLDERGDADQTMNYESSAADNTLFFVLRCLPKWELHYVWYVVCNQEYLETKKERHDAVDVVGDFQVHCHIWWFFTKSGIDLLQ